MQMIIYSLRMCVCVQPLQLKTDQRTLSAVKRVLKSKSKTDDRLRRIFAPVIPFVSEVVTSLLSELHSKNPSGR